MAAKVIIINPRDNVAIALTDLKKGVVLELPDGREVLLAGDIPYSHKVALRDIPKGGRTLSNTGRSSERRKSRSKRGSGYIPIIWTSRPRTQRIQKWQARGERYGNLFRVREVGRVGRDQKPRGGHSLRCMRKWCGGGDCARRPGGGPAFSWARLRPLG